jgi:lysine-specific demethylase 3
MYIAMAILGIYASTRLHMDLTDAVNLMVWSGKGGDGQPGYALWHIFDATATPLLRKYICEKLGFEGPGDPIHSQTVYLTPEDIEILATKYGVQPYTIRQYPGDAVFIPALSPHQVSFMSFVYPHRLI